jgi:hypothetical protein
MIRNYRPEDAREHDGCHRHKKHHHGAIRLVPSKRPPLLFIVLIVLIGCFPVAKSPNQPAPPIDRVRPLERLERYVLGPIVPRPTTILGARLIADAPRPAAPAAAVARSIVRSNPRLEPFDALERGAAVVKLAAGNDLPYGFFAATILQESAFEDEALSAAGAVGIGQFTLDTAAAEGVDPYAWRDALRGSARLLGRYVAAYSAQTGDPYATALAAYNAGPGAVEHYGGVPPYPETVEYIRLVQDRWSRIVRDASPGGIVRPRPF